jgi:hypothetical protein
MSEGIRSGVNWIRENCRSSAWARLLTSRVLASPGHADEQAVTAGEQADEQQVDHALLADDAAVQLLDQALAAAGERLQGGAIVGGKGSPELGRGTSGGPRGAGGCGALGGGRGVCTARCREQCRG